MRRVAVPQTSALIHPRALSLPISSHGRRHLKLVGKNVKSILRPCHVLTPNVNGKFPHFGELHVLVSPVGGFVEFVVFFFHFDPSSGWWKGLGVFCFSLLSPVPWRCDCSKGMRREKTIKSKLLSWLQGGKVLHSKNEKELTPPPPPPSPSSPCGGPEQLPLCCQGKASPSFSHVKVLKVHFLIMNIKCWEG